MCAETKTERFWRWAEEKLDERGLSWYRVEREAGLANGTISKRARELLQPTRTTIKAISDIFEIPRTFVFKAAGDLPIQIIGDTEQEEMLDYFHALDARNRRTLLKVAETLYAEQEGDSENDIPNRRTTPGYRQETRDDPEEAGTPDNDY